MATKIIYLDNAATTKPHEEVLKSYLEVSKSYFANTSSIHGLGVKSNDLLSKARSQILRCFKCNEHDLIFTSGATESNNLAIKGYAFNYKNRGKHIITSRVEHPSVLESMRQLENLYGFEVTYLPVNSKGIISIKDLENSIRKDTILISLMAVNNEVGAINPIHEITKIVKKYPKLALHIDATQAVGKINFKYHEADLISFSGHKIHAIKGVGGLIIRKNISLVPNNCGGGQEDGLRSGTVDLASDVALAKAVRIAYETKESKTTYIREIIKPLEQYLNDNPHLYELNSSIEENPYIINFSLKNKKASVVVEGLSNDGIMISSISACHSKGEKASYVVKEMGKDDTLSHNTLRISPSEENTKQEIEIFVNKLDQIVKGIRN